MATSEVLAWLLAGDAAVAYVATRDLLGRDDPELQARIATEGAGAAILAARGANGHWGRGFYQPKWTSSHYTLLQLRGMGLSRTHPAAVATVQLILETEKAADGGVSPSPPSKPSDACVNGMALGYASWFGAAEDELRSVVDFLLRERVTDGGFNCRHNRPGARVTHSSVHTTVCVMEGITDYVRSGAHYRRDELEEAYASSAEFLLRHRLLRSETTGGSSARTSRDCTSRRVGTTTSSGGWIPLLRGTFHVTAAWARPWRCCAGGGAPTDGGTRTAPIPA